MHLRPLASDIWLFPRRNRRQLGGRRHHLRRLIREHAWLHHLRMRTMRPIQNYDRRRRDPRRKDDRDRALARKERPPGFGRSHCWLRAPDAHFCFVRDRRRPRGRDDNRVCPHVLVPPLAKSRPRFGLGFGAPRSHDRRRGFRLPGTGEGDEPRKGAFRTLTPTRTARAILRLDDKQRRRFSEHLVTPTLGGTTLVRTRLLRKTHGSLIDRGSLPVETGTFLGLG